MARVVFVSLVMNLVFLSVGCVSDAPEAGANTGVVASDAGTDTANATDSADEPDLGCDCPASGSDGVVDSDAGTDGATTDSGTEPLECECPASAAPDNTVPACDENDQCIYECAEGATACDSGACAFPSLESTSCGLCEVQDCTQTVAANSVASCEVTDDAPLCSSVCAEGWSDANDDPSDGCECPSSGDLAPDSSFPTACASLVAGTVFVDPAGTGDGLTPDEPIDSLSGGIALARETGRNVIVVAQSPENGVLSETIVIDAPAGGLAIYGGYNPTDGWVRSGETVLDGADPNEPTLIVKNTTATDFVRLSNLRILNSGQTAAGMPSITMWVDSAAEGSLSMQDVTIVGGNAADGQEGVGGSAGQNGGHGSDAQGTSTSGARGGAGGDSACNVLVGGRGGDSSAPSCATMPPTPATADDGVQGRQGGAVSRAAGGAGGTNVCNASADQMVGGSGGSAVSITVPVPATASAVAVAPMTLLNSGWQASRGEEGLDGPDAASGGGGGGGGSSTRNIADNVTAEIGGGGGGGGGAGCGGDGGGGGEAGADSISLFLRDSQVDLSGVTIHYGVAGDGGKGGDGACGGLGGRGGSGGSATSAYAANGGSGGNGGSGQAGAGGAGGNGGSVVAVARIASSFEGEPSIDDATGTPGAPGAGGAMGGQARTDVGFVELSPATCGPPSSTLPSSSGASGSKLSDYEFP